MQVLSHDALAPADYKRGDHFRTIGDALVQEGKTFDLSRLVAPDGSDFITKVYNLAEATDMMREQQGARLLLPHPISFPEDYPAAGVKQQLLPPTQAQLAPTAEHVAEVARRLAERVAAGRAHARGSGSGRGSGSSARPGSARPGSAQISFPRL
jgi:hypothetical protein